MQRSAAHTVRHALFVIASGIAVSATCLPAGSSFAQSTTMPLAIAVEPPGMAEELSFSESRGTTPPVTLAAQGEITDQPLEVEIPLPASPLDGGTITVEWDNGSRSGFPIVRGAVFAARPVYVKLLHRVLDATPRLSEVSAACVQTVPASPDAAFEMYFECREMALQLERAGRKWEKSHRIALEGWLVANYYLYTRVNPVSPYGADPDLVSRLREVLQRDADRPGGDWRPLRLPDARNLVLLVDDEVVRLAGQVPVLIDLGQYEAASEVNAAALAVLEATEESAYGLSIEVLTGNQDLLQGIGF